MTIIFDGTQGITTPAETANNSVTTPVVKSGSALTLQTNGSTTAVTIDTSQNVGIGTSSPGCKLDVYNSAAAAANNEIFRLRWVTSTTAGHSGDLNFTNQSGTPIGRISNIIQDGTNVALAFSTYGNSLAERMRIDSVGRVTKPYQPAFHVRVNDANYITTSPVPFTNVVFDVGSNFNTSTYRFTAPIAGKYYLFLNMYLTANVNQDSYPRFRINGSFVQYSYLYQTAGGTIHNTVVMNRIFNLSVGDYVDVTFAGNGTYYGGNQETNFYGYLLG